MIDFIKKFLLFVKRRNLWYFIPIFAALLVVGIIIILAETPGVGPFIYTIF